MPLIFKIPYCVGSGLVCESRRFQSIHAPQYPFISIFLSKLASWSDPLSASNSDFQFWRRRGDSNSRDPFEPAAFPRRCTRPLCDVSVCFFYTRKESFYHVLSDVVFSRRGSRSGTAHQYPLLALPVTSTRLFSRQPLPHRRHNQRTTRDHPLSQPYHPLFPHCR